MRSRHIAMTPAEFERLPREPGWRYEYDRGTAHITPRHVVVPMRVAVTRRAVDPCGLRLRPITPEDAPGLAGAFLDGFRDTVEYCDYTDARIRRSGEDAIATFFGGKRGAFHPASCLAVSPAQPRAVAGAALIVRKSSGPFLDMLFIRERWHRQGLATALVGSVLNALHDAGEAHLGSAYNLANQPSRTWHEKFGFVEQPDAFLARVRAQVSRHELWRRQETGVLTEAEREGLQAEAERWERLAVALEEDAVSRRAAARARRQSSPA